MFPLTCAPRSRVARALLPTILLAYAPSIGAQQAEDPIPPDVLLLVDTSGSMEDLIDDHRQDLLNNPDPNRAAALPACTYAPGDVTARGSTPDGANRWGTAVQTLTGTLKPYFACARLPRLGAPFEDEYKFNGATPVSSG